LVWQYSGSLVHKDCEEHEVKDGAHHTEQGGNEHESPGSRTFLAWSVSAASTVSVAIEIMGKSERQVHQQDLERQHGRKLTNSDAMAMA